VSLTFTPGRRAAIFWLAGIVLIAVPSLGHNSG
jgi:hypothetical protein